MNHFFLTGKNDQDIFSFFYCFYSCFYRFHRCEITTHGIYTNL